MATDDQTLNKELAARLAELPEVVREAIKSADVQKLLRELADKHKLHLDQWQHLENEVMLALLAFEPIEDLQENIRKNVGVGDVTAVALAADVSKMVFEPIREKLERELEHPEAQGEKVGGVEQARSDALKSEPAAGESKPTVPLPQPPPSVAPATPPAPPPTEKAARAPTTSVYKPGEASTERKNVHDDPYREAPN